jgi:glutamate-1-semialdehyde 2,1-aminomutase
MSERLHRIIPVCDLVRYNGSGSEAVAMALRIARAATGREKFIKFEGHYHGWPDPVIISYWPDPATAGPREAPRPAPGSGGMVRSALEEVIVLPWNDLDIIEQTLKTRGHEVAALITEPIMFNSGGIAPKPGFLEGLRRLCSAYGVIFIMDEVISGFRVALGGAQEKYGVTPDLATYAKGLAAGLPLSAIAGRRELMDLITTGQVLHGGTYNTHPVVMAGANAGVKYLEENKAQVYPHLYALGDRLRAGLREIASRHGVPALVSGIGPVVQMSFTEQTAFSDYRDFARRDQEGYRRFVAALGERGVRTILRGIWYISTAHTLEDIDTTLDRADEAMAAVL